MYVCVCWGALRRIYVMGTGEGGREESAEDDYVCDPVRADGRR